MLDLKNICKKELTETIISFWNNLIDRENGGFYGFMDNNLVVDKNADKGVILNSRILWFYSAAYKVLRDEELLKYAKHAYEFLREHCVDYVNGGVFWKMKFDGTVSDSMKHTYNQAFAIYALATYFSACGEEEVLELAFEIYDTVEEKCSDEISYGEAFTKEFKYFQNDALSENGLMAEKTMNTVLHLVEAYTVLLEVSGDADVLAKLTALLDITERYIYDEKNHKLNVFFDEKYNLVGDIHSYGHDIEATWLIDRACEAICDVELTEKWREINLKISQNILEIAFENGALNNERDKNEIDKRRVWWVQAEAVVGFVNAYMQSENTEYLETASKVMEFIQNFQKDKRENSEWWGEVSFEGEPMETVEMVNPWKCPYHNGRMCIEILERKF